MRLLIYLGIAIIAAYIGYKIAEITILNKQIKSNVQPIVDELRLQLTTIQNSIQNASPEEKVKLEIQKKNIVELLAKFYGYTTDELTALLNKA